MAGSDLRHTGPWPSGNDERAVCRWLMEWIGGDEAQSKAWWLLDHVTETNRGLRLIDYRYSESELNALALLAQSCAAGVPVQHVVGWTEFFGLRLHVDGRALIPRPETEELVDACVRWAKSTSVSRICDAGTGTGCIALAVRNQLPLAEVHAIDASAEALELAMENAKLTGLDVKFHQLTFKELGQGLGQPFDLVISNPPYIPASERSKMADLVTHHDPEMALFVPDEEPLVHYMTLVEACLSNEVLRKGGLLAFEVHEEFAEAVAALCASAHWTSADVVLDLQGKQRMVLAQKGSR